MTKALLRVRFRALFHSMLRQSRQKRRHGTGMTVLFILLFAYVGVVFCGMFALMFSKLAPAYHTAGAGLAVLCHGGAHGPGPVGIWQRLCHPKSNLRCQRQRSAPVHAHPTPDHSPEPGASLMVLNGVFSLLVLGPAGVVYGTMVG